MSAYLQLSVEDKKVFPAVFFKQKLFFCLSKLTKTKKQNIAKLHNRVHTKISVSLYKKMYKKQRHPNACCRCTTRVVDVQRAF